MQSNLYIERIFSEHPLGCWSLDDPISYREILVYPESRYESTWEFDIPAGTIAYSPVFDKSPLGDYQYAVSYSDATVLSYTGTIDASNFNPGRQALFSFFYFADPSTVPALDFGVVVDGTTYTSTINTRVGWTFASIAFDPAPGNVVPFISFPDPAGSALVSLTRPSISQWADEFVRTELGYESLPVPEELAYVITRQDDHGVVRAEGYGIAEDPGYFIINETTHKEYFKRAGIPLVYGSNNAISIYPGESSNPSIVVPGKGMLNQAGRYNNYTLEAWVRFHNSSPDPVRLIGPAASTDGIYVEEGFLTIAIGPYTKSYFVGNFDRPMLLHFEYSPTRASLLINGEQVIEMPIDQDNITFPTARNSLGVPLDWIGVYGNTLVTNFDLDLLAIFPYLLPPEIAKRHFVYGQGVEEADLTQAEKINVTFDYSFADYAFNLSYPAQTPWYAGYGVNLNTTSTTLKPNAYKVPEVIIKDADGATVDQTDWFQNNAFANEALSDLFPYILMYPSGDETSTIYFKSINQISDRVQSVFMFGKSEIGANQPLLAFSNTITGAKLFVTLDDETLEYSYVSPSGSAVALTSASVASNEYFTAGIDIPTFVSTYYPIIGNFFAEPAKVALNVGGYGQDMFNGRLFGVHFTNKFFHTRYLTDKFSGGVTVQDAGLDELASYIGNYSLLPIVSNTSMKFDIGERGYWEDFLPLSMFTKRVDDNQYALDFLQFNINIPYGYGYDDIPGIYYYYQLNALYNLPDHDYDYFATLWSTYDDIVPSISGTLDPFRYATALNSFITIQPMGTVGTNLYSSFAEEENFNDNVIYVDDLTKKYRVYDNSIILLPEFLDPSSYYIGLHLETIVRGTTEKSMFVRRMELASFASLQSADWPIGTKYGNPVYKAGDA